MISALPVLGGRKSYFPAVSMVIHEDECHNDMREFCYAIIALQKKLLSHHCVADTVETYLALLPVTLFSK